MLTVVILTCNEEAHILRTIQNVQNWADQVFILDSFSEDRTCEIAQESGAIIFQHPFENYAAQREWALRELPYRTEWMLFLDADELVSDELKTEITIKLAEPTNSINGYYLNRRFYWMGKWLRRGGMYPVWILRLVKHKNARSNPRRVNEHLEVDGETQKISGDLLHVDLKTISDWIKKHNRYASLEAQEYVDADQTRNSDSLAKLFGTQPERKRWIREKIWNPLVPTLVRPFVYFLYVYFVRLGILDGKAGFIYHVLHGFCYRFMIEAKYISLKNQSNESVNLSTGFEL